MNETIHIIISKPTEATDWRAGYYPPLSSVAYHAGVVAYQLPNPPGWNVYHTRPQELELPLSYLSRRLSHMVRLEGDGLRPFQEAALAYAIPQDCLTQFKHLYDNRDLSLTSAGFSVRHKLSDFTYWMGWNRLELFGLVEDCGEQIPLDLSMKINYYRFTSKGWLMSKLAAEVYQWSTSV